MSPRAQPEDVPYPPPYQEVLFMLDRVARPSGSALHARTTTKLPTQCARAAAMAQLIPSAAAAWDELLVGNFVRFEAAYTIWMQCV